MWQWFVTSSADPTKTSLALRGALLSLLPIIMLLTGMAEVDVKEAIEAVVNFVTAALALVSAGTVLYGLYRKVLNGRWSARQ